MHDNKLTNQSFAHCAEGCVIYQLQLTVARLQELGKSSRNFIHELLAQENGQYPTAPCVTALNKFLLLNKLLYRQREILITLSLFPIANSYVFKVILNLCVI